MISATTIRKRQQLMAFIERVLAPEPAVQAVIAVGSVASGLARPDSDIDAIVFLDPFDWYIVPAESYWCPSDGSFHSIFSEEGVGEECVQLDFARLDLAEWADPSHDWSEERRAELCKGCETACPVDIPLTSYLAHMREDAKAKGLAPETYRKLSFNIKDFGTPYGTKALEG